MMEMRYYRFLYGAGEECFVHFGELQDTRTQESFTFLYLKGTKRRVGQGVSACRPFLYPGHIDLVITGSADQCVLQALDGFLRDTWVDTLVLNAKCRFAYEKLLPGIREIITLSEETFQTDRAGWSFAARPCADGSVTMAYALAEGTGRNEFGDCVMSVKPLREEAWCRKAAAPDGYGCALGCALHRDFDVCKYRGGRKKPVFCTGTLLPGDDESAEGVREMLALAHIDEKELRFLVLPATAVGGLPEKSLRQDPERYDMRTDGFRRYLIGTEELDDRRIADVCREGWYLRPVILRKGEAVCCSGFLKYVK